MSATPHQKRAKRIRESFTLPEGEHAAIEVLKARAIAMGTRAKKSELLRAGLMVLMDLNEAAYKRALAAVPQRRTKGTLEALPTPVSGASKTAKPRVGASAPPAPRPSRTKTRNATPKRQPRASGVKRSP